MYFLSLVYTLMLVYTLIKALLKFQGIFRPEFTLIDSSKLTILRHYF